MQSVNPVTLDQARSIRVFRRLPQMAAALRLVLALALCAISLAAAPVQAQGVYDPKPLIERLTPEVMARVFPNIDRLEMVADDGPIAAAAYRTVVTEGTIAVREGGELQGGSVDEELVGYVFSTLDVLRAPGYSSTPFDVIAGVEMDGRVTGAVVLYHLEPYLLNDTVRTSRLVTFLDSLAGVDGRLGAPGGIEPGFVSGATISARAMRNAVQEGAGMVLGFRTDRVEVTEPTIDIFNFKPLTADELTAMGALARAKITNGQLAEAMQNAGLADFLPEIATIGGANDLYADIVFGYANPPKVGRNGVSGETFDQLVNGLPEGTMAIYVGSLGGVFDHRGARYNNLSTGLSLNRINVSQGDTTYTFHKQDALSSFGRIADLLILPEGNDFDPFAPWSAEVIAAAKKPDGSLVEFQLAALDYELPEQLILMPPPDPSLAWLEPWVEQKLEIAILGAALTLLTLILAFQGALTRRRWLYRWVRDGFLAFTLIWIGWIASAQLSIVNVLNYLKAPFEDLSWTFYMAEPLIVMISIYTAISLILLGRGVFCGWLCPFGALQELLARLARAVKLPQWNPSEKLQRKLWWGKYASLALILTLAVFAPAAGSIAQEIEPFKTAITAMFARGWPYLIYAVILLTIGLFTERAFCRFLCPLGGFLAILDRLHLIELLKRRPECGSPCHLCERSCPVKAIESSGKIKMAECFQCLDCMVEYYDDRRCPPLAKQRKALERALKIPAKDAAKKAA